MPESGKKIKVLHVMESLIGGGGEEWIKNICTLCDKHGFSFKVYSCGFIYDSSLFNYTDEFKRNGIEVISRKINLTGQKNKTRVFKDITNRSGSLKQIRRFFITFLLCLIAFWDLLFVLRRERFDIIHVHMYRLFIPAGLIGRLYGKAVVHTVPGLKSQLDSYQPLNFWIYRHFNYLADIFVTGVPREELINHANVPESKVRHIKGGVDLTKISVVKREDNPVISEFNLGTSFPVLLSVGRMDPEKGHAYSIRAVKSLIPRFPDLKLIILGDGPDMEKMRSLVSELGLGGCVILPGFRKDIVNFHSLSDAYLRTSIFEGANMASLWAMAYGKAIVAFDTKSGNEILSDGENGILVPLKDAGKLAEAIGTLCDDEELRERIGRNARKLICDKFDIMDTIRTYEDIYRSSLDEASLG
ncbi:MAG: glycosyltransferase [Candidatus Omnitrophica bacterium]|nr:glycosyltransferase [Candidatus Omnitrophota bacterium]